MAVDEFGREILRGSSRPSPDNLSGDYNYNNASFLNDALPTGRHEDPSSRGRESGHGRSSSSYYHSHQLPSSHHSQHSHGRRSDHRLSSQHPRKRKDREDSNFGDGMNSLIKSSGTQRNKSKMPHPSTLYVEEPMLCQFLWKENQNGDGEMNAGVEGNNGDAKPSATKLEIEGKLSDTNDDSDSTGYDDYRKSYCLNYVRTFFNKHMDDTWFRESYSPLKQYQLALQEQTRARGEAQAFAADLQRSLDRNAGDSSRCFFVLKARLGGGIKQTNNVSLTDVGGLSTPNKASSSSSLSNPVPETHVISLASQVLPIEEVPPHVTDRQLVSALISQIKGLKREHIKVYSSSVPGNGNLFRTAYVQSSHPNIHLTDLIQQLSHTASTAAVTTAIATGEASHVPRKEDTYIPKSIRLEVECSDAYGRLEVDVDGKGGDGDGDGPEEVTPQTASVWISTRRMTVPIVVLSAAVSSQTRIAEDSEAAQTLAKAYDIRCQIPLEARFESLIDKALPNQESSKNHLQDLEDTLDLAVAYLRRVHLVSFYNGCTKATRVADVLNGQHAASSIHLRLSNADEILQEAVSAVPPTALSKPTLEISTKDTVEHRSNVDDESNAPSVEVDLLVQRHKSSIDKSLNNAHEWLQEGDDKWQGVLIDTETDLLAKQIQEAEKNVEPVWVEDHSVLDEDGRARCSFHFCRKLFKDSAFLKKHLLKKHSEFLQAECAKCHDQFMMEKWDAQERRPIPPILVDCGRAFSLVQTQVVGSTVPIAEDPEPDLWRRQEERRRQDEQMRKERQERNAQYNGSRSGDGGEDNGADGPLNAERTTTPRISKSFVDVDDMQEEKIELALENVEVPVQPPKKKRKKKKLL